MADGDFDTDMQTIRDYVAAVVEKQTKIAVAYTGALANVETTFQNVSPADAKPDILKVVIKNGFKILEKSAVTGVQEATHVDLGPLVDMIHQVYDEVDRAAAAAASLSAAEWVKNLRTSITNAYTQGQTGDALRQQIEGEYKQNDEGGRGGYIAGIQNELTALGSVNVPLSQVIETSIYEQWIVQNFNNDAVDGTGFITLNYNSDGTADKSEVTASLGAKIAGGLNNVMSAAGKSMLMDLAVVKKLVKDDKIMCFEDNNTVRKTTDDADATQFLTSKDNWRLFTSFSV